MHSKSCRLQRKGGDHDGKSGEGEKRPRNRSGSEKVKGESRFNGESIGRKGGEGRTQGEELEKTWEKKEVRRRKVRRGSRIKGIERYGRHKIRIEERTIQAHRSIEKCIVSCWITERSLINL
jgi:hypothetical protein